MKVAIVHYWFITRRGGEKVVESLLKIFPDADIYTLFYDEEKYGNTLKEHKIYVSSFNNKLIRKHYQKLFPIYPLAVKSLKLKDDYDLIISSESGPAKGIVIPNNIPHLCYIHSPMRYCWGYTDEYLKVLPKGLKGITAYFFERLRKWDETTINNVTHYIANSENVADRVKRFYNRDSVVIPPPISLELFNRKIKKNKIRQTYLSFGAITPYKRIDLLIDTFNDTGENLVIVGDGSEKMKLMKKAKSNIKFTGTLSWDKIEEILKDAKALIFPGEEDFGMIPLEIMAYGIPVIAFKKGGALETVIENRNNIAESTGIFFEEQTENSLKNALLFYERHESEFCEEFIVNHARSFGEDVFINSFKSFCNDLK